MVDLVHFYLGCASGLQIEVVIVILYVMEFSNCTVYHFGDRKRHMVSKYDNVITFGSCLKIDDFVVKQMKMSYEVWKKRYGE